MRDKLHASMPMPQTDSAKIERVYAKSLIYLHEMIDRLCRRNDRHIVCQSKWSVIPNGWWQWFWVYTVLITGRRIE